MREVTESNRSGALTLGPRTHEGPCLLRSVISILDQLQAIYYLPARCRFSRMGARSDDNIATVIV